jgi:hypothetical protein
MSEIPSTLPQEVATTPVRHERNPYDYLTCHDRHAPRNATSPPHALDSAYPEMSASRRRVTSPTDLGRLVDRTCPDHHSDAARSRPATYGVRPHPIVCLTRRRDLRSVTEGVLAVMSLKVADTDDNSPAP